MRDAFVRALMREMKSNDRIVLVTGDLGFSQAEFAGYVSFMGIASILVQPLLGRLLVRFRKYVRVICLIAGIVGLLLFFLSARCSRLHQFYIVGDQEAAVAYSDISAKRTGVIHGKNAVKIGALGEQITQHLLTLRDSAFQLWQMNDLLVRKRETLSSEFLLEALDPILLSIPELGAGEKDRFFAAFAQQFLRGHTA